MPIDETQQPPLIEYRNVSVMRGERPALDSLSFSIGCGEHVAILGPNGSGKSTLIKTITRECYPLNNGPGSWLRILGEESWNVFELRSLLGIVSNDLMASCTRPYSGMEIVLSGFFSSIGVWPNHHVTGRMEEKARATMELLEIGHLAARGVDEMSSGEARRFLIARALVHDPKALVLDEPTNSLDVHSVHGVQAILRKIARAGTGVILVTHHLPDIIPEVDRVIFLNGGRVTGDGAKEELLTPERLSALFRTPVEMVRRDGFYHMW